MVQYCYMWYGLVTIWFLAFALGLFSGCTVIVPCLYGEISQPCHKFFRKKIMLTITELSAFHRAGRIELSQKVALLRQEWCPFAQRVGRCDCMCSANPFCVQNIQGILDIQGEPRSLRAVLLWRARTARAEIAEAFEQPALARDRFGEAKSDFLTAIRRAGGHNAPTNLVPAQAGQAAGNLQDCP